MALVSEEFMLQEASLTYGTWGTPDDIVGTADPETEGTWSETGNLGYLRRGTLKYGIADEYVEYLSETPSMTIRRDLLRRNVTLEFTMNQFSMTHFGLAYSMVTAAGSAYDLSSVGHNIVVKTRYGFLLSGTLIDGSVIKFAVWSGEFSSDDLTLNWTGDDYVDIPIKIQAFPHSEFLVTRALANDRKDYGMIWQPNT